MKLVPLIGLLVSIGCVSALGAPVAPAPSPVLQPHVQGDYVEARTASVFAGACHYNGELVTIGHDAVAAWNITAGSWHGVGLAGVRAMAAITSDANLGDAQSARHCELVIDRAATPAQAQAFTDWIAAHRSTLGDVTAVHRLGVRFDHQGSVYTVSADRFAAMTVQSMPNNDCCKQPNLVWYTPLQPLEHRKVGYTVDAAYQAGTLADPWQRSDENSAFYGTFAE